MRGDKDRCEDIANTQALPAVPFHPAQPQQQPSLKDAPNLEVKQEKLWRSIQFAENVIPNGQITKITAITHKVFIEHGTSCAYRILKKSQIADAVWYTDNYRDGDHNSLTFRKNMLKDLVSKLGCIRHIL
ncbi:hypothetical protein NPIL_664851 [Nephila pilipes]|uniref:Uncharacterized protein n=1 Tax=Nephila pilipes TaxID=299642 RepID=A0A8X6QCW5_NEPPI|nr:hypothetical protein NPIL_664851 [Nephila pilipes]